MGNVHATAVPPPKVSFDSSRDSNKNSESEETSTPRTGENAFSCHPGTIEDLHKRCKDVFPNPAEGVRLIINKGLNNHFQVSHTLTMSNTMPSGYRFGATYVGTNIVGPGEAYPVLVGEVDPNGNVNANIIHQIHPRIKTKLTAQVCAFEKQSNPI